MRLYGTMEIDNDGVLNIGGVSSLKLVEEFGTPLLVLDEAEIINNIQLYNKAFREFYPDFALAYAGKAFMNRTLCKILEARGIGIDVVSGGELFMALQAGFPAADIYFHGNNKSEDEIKMALESGVGRIMLDNLQEAFLLNQLSDKKQKVILRVTPGIEAHTHEFIQTGQLDSKFGVSVYRGQALETIREILKMDNLELMGIHSHIGSQIFNMTSFARVVDVLMELMVEVREKTSHTLTELDLGGGLGVAYLEEEELSDINEYARIISERVIKNSSRHRFPEPRVIIEPGRSIIATAGTTLYRVGTIKEIPSVRKYIAVDGGMTDNIRPALYGAEYEALIANRALDSNEEMVTVTGKCCESGDILINNINLPEAENGDILAISCTGAYTYSMANNYNLIPRPAVVIVKDGKADLIIRRESYEDLLKYDILPERFKNEVSLS
ncbi:MAG TPA: diaminopimelate decarboxylase [Halanaerobiales bacterium]|nr:diaminopimelate decarboxylase [Halanaerobiales bacterium]